MKMESFGPEPKNLSRKLYTLYFMNFLFIFSVNG